MHTQNDIRSWSSIFLVAILLLISACGGGKAPLTAEEQQQYEELVNLVENREFEIVNDWASSQRGNNVSLIGNANFIRFKGDSVDIFLPYFGERYSGGGYGTSGGIEYKGLIQDLEIEERSKKQDLLLRFEGEQDSEQLQFLIRIYPNGNTNTSVTTSERSSISYRGEIVE